MKKKVVTAFMMAALGSSLVFSQAVMAIDTTAKTETSEDADKDSTESEDKDVAEDADKADEEKEDLKTIGEKPEEDTEGVFSVKLKNLTGKVITGVPVDIEADEDGVHIRKHVPTCHFCGTVDDVKTVYGIEICRGCAEKIMEEFKG